MDIRDIYKKYVALEEQATLTVTADNAEEIASLLGVMKGAGAEHAHVVGEPEQEVGGCSVCGGDHSEDSPCSAGDDSWDNSPDEYMQDLADITFLAGGGPNGPKHPGDIRVKDPRASENIEEWDNEPEEEYKDDSYMTKDMSGGINREKKAYAKAQDGDNAIAVESSYKDRLWAALQEKQHNRRPDSPDLDGDGDTEEPIAQAAKDAKKKK